MQIPSVCTVSTTGHAAAWPDRAARDQHGELADEVDLLLGEQARRAALACAACRATASSQSVGLVGGGDDAHALAVVAAARGLDHDRPADLVAEGLQRRRVRRPAPSAGRGRRSRSSRATHGQLVLGEARALPGLGCSATPSASSAARHVGRDVLVVERDDVAVAGERAHGLEVGVASRPGADGTTSAADASGASAEHAQRRPPARRPGLAHPGELPAADDADDGESAGVRRCGDVTPREPTGATGAPLAAAGPTLSAPWPLQTPHPARPRPRRDGRPRARDAQVRSGRRGGVRRRHRRVQPAAVRLRRGPPAGPADAGQDHLGDPAPPSWPGWATGYWTFRHRRQRQAHHELLLFVAFNVVGMAHPAGLPAVSPLRAGPAHARWPTTSAPTASGWCSARCSASGPTAGSSSPASEFAPDGDPGHPHLTSTGSGSRLRLGQEQREDHRLGLDQLEPPAVGLGEVAGEGEAQPRAAAA